MVVVSFTGRLIVGASEVFDKAFIVTDFIGQARGQGIAQGAADEA